MREADSGGRERGMAMVVALLVLLVLAIIGILLMSGTMVGPQGAGPAMSAHRALRAANAGVGEAIAHLRAGNAVLSAANPRATALILLAGPGELPAMGPDTTAIATTQPPASRLPYSTAAPSLDALTITFETDVAHTQIYTYDPSVWPAMRPGVGSPIYQIRSTGTAGNARRTVVVEVTAQPVRVTVSGALSAGGVIRDPDAVHACGHDHALETPAGTSAAGAACAAYEARGVELPATWSPGPAGLATDACGLLALSQADFVTFMGAPTAHPASLDGIVYADDDRVMGNRSAHVKTSATSGQGMLYVDGDLTIQGPLRYEGLVVVEGDLRVEGRAWILGALVVRGRTSVRGGGALDVLYSSAALTQRIAQYGDAYLTLSRREE